MSAPHRAGRHFLQIPGPTNVPDRILRAIAQPTIDHRGPEFARAHARVVAGGGPGLSHRRPGDHLPQLGHRGLGGGAGERARARRSGAGLRDRALRRAVAGDGDAARAAGRARARRLAPRGRPGGRAPTTRRRSPARDQGRHGRAQRDLDGRHESRGGGPRRDRCRRASGAAAGRHDLLARLDRLPPRRVGRRRDRRRLAEGTDAAAGTGVQRRQREGARVAATGRVSALLLRLGADHRGQPRRLLSLHPGDQPALRACARRSRCSRRRRSTPCSPATSATPRPRAAPCGPGGWRCSARTSASTRRC